MVPKVEVEMRLTQSTRIWTKPPTRFANECSGPVQTGAFQGLLQFAHEGGISPSVLWHRGMWALTLLGFPLLPQ